MMPTPVEAAIPFMDLARHHQPLRDEFRAAFDRVLDRNAFVLGEEVERFERAFAGLCGTDHCVGVGSGTAALTIMLKAAGIGRGDEVIVPAHTFIASALAVKHAGGTPVCVDVEDGSGLLDPNAVEAGITPRTAAILAVHLYGQVCAMDPLRAIARRHGLLLFEDAAQAHGARYQDRVAGGLGDAAAFSFYPSKNLGGLGDGGAITTNDPSLADAARKLRDLGRWGGASHDSAGFNERLDGLQAALLGVKLPHLDAWNAARRRHARAYRDRLLGVTLLAEHDDSPSIYHLFPIRVPDRDALGGGLRARSVGYGIHYPLALPDQPALPELHGADTPVARAWAREVLSLPLFPELTPPEIARVVEVVNTRTTVGQERG